MIIDTHHHFWNYDPIDYDWIDEDMKVIRKDFLPEHLFLEIKKAGVDGVISIQARQSLEETDWLLKLASENSMIKGIVGWVPLMDSRLESELEKYVQSTLFKGVRHVVQGEPDGFLAGDAFNKGICLLSRYDLVYDILVLEHQLNEAVQFVSRHPKQSFVIDHIAKPCIREGSFDGWEKGILAMAQNELVTCKLSGLVTEANFKTWTEAQLRPYLEVVLDAFGPNRLMFGSDWPVCLVATEYEEWLSLIHRFISSLSSDEQNEILYGTAQRVYSI